MPTAYVGANVFAYLGVSDAERITETAMNELTARLRRRLSAP